MPNKPIIALYTTIQGHLSIAQAIAEVLKTQYQVEFFHEESSLFKLYRPIYQFFPAIFQVPYSMSKNQSTAKTVSLFFKRHYDRQISEFSQRIQPAVNISTYFMFNPSLEEVQTKQGIPLINVMSDPRTIHPVAISNQAEQNLVFDEYQHQQIKNLKLSVKCTSVGWFVRDEFEQAYDQAVVRRRLKLNADYLTFLIVAGSDGTTHILKVLPALFATNVPVQIIIACGNNSNLYRATLALRRLLKTTNPQHSLIALKFTPKMYEYMQAADLIIGKAGPNSLFEAVATKTPFFAITHIAGQEDGNLDIIREYNLGYVEENIFKAQKILQEIINNPEQLKNFAKPLAKLAMYNHHSKQTLLQIVSDQLKT